MTVTALHASRRLAVTGELDAVALPRFCASLQEALADLPSRLVLDLAGCPFVDAAALTVLLDAHRTTARYGGELVLAGCTPRVLRVLSVTGLGRVFALEP